MIEFIIQNLPKVGDELLQCAMANCDSIEALKMFRGHCKPIWLFIVSGIRGKIFGHSVNNYNFLIIGQTVEVS